MNIKKELVQNKGIFIILIFVSAIVLLSKINSAYSQSATEKYYRYVIVDNRNEIKGKYPVEESLAKNIHSYGFIYNENSILIKIENLNINCTKPFPVRDFRNNYVSQEDWYEIKIEYIDKSEKRIYINQKGEIYAYELIEKNKLLNTMSQTNYCCDGFLQNKYIWKLDEDGKKISEQFIDNQVGFDYISTCKYNEDGYKIEQRFYNENGQLETHYLRGYAIIQSDYDEYGNEIERRYYGDNLELISQEYGFTSIQFDYDKDGNMIEKRYYGINNELKEYKFMREDGGGHAIIRYKYDPKGNILEISFYDTNNRLKELDKEGTAIHRWKYDMNCNDTEERFYGADGKLKEPRDPLTGKKCGYAIIKKEFNNYGKIVERSYFGTNEKLNLISSGNYAIERYKYDKIGKMIEVSYFGLDGKLKVVNFGYGRGYNDYAIVRIIYNELGKEVERSYYDADEKLINR